MLKALEPPQLLKKLTLKNTGETREKREQNIGDKLYFYVKYGGSLISIFLEVFR